MTGELDFELLDDVLPMLGNGKKSVISAAMTNASVGPIGPLLEYAFQANGYGGQVPSFGNLAQSEPVAALQQTLSLGGIARVPLSASHEAEGVEFTWVPPSSGTVNAPQWTMFLRRLQSAAEKSGFPTKIAKGLVGAFIEMTDNVLLHSQRAASGIAGYRWTLNCFEFAVADAGIGVLASLRSSYDYAQLADAGTALQVALQDGESRRGRGSGYGNGFRRLLISLTNLNGTLRFRSGDHALTIDGTSPESSMPLTSNTIRGHW